MAAVPGPAPSNWDAWLLKKIASEHKGIGEKWIGGWLLGKGGEGVTALWVAVNDKNRVAGRMVAKTLSSNATDRWQSHQWHDGLNATGYQDFNARINHQLPKEAIVHQRLSTLSDPPQAPLTEYPICNYIGHGRVDERNRRWKLFLEFCPYKDLDELVDIYDRNQTPFPEAFIWYVAHECLVAAQVMLQGSTTVARSNWRQVVHRDLKVGNILLSGRDSDRFRYYPKVKIADFGLAAETDINDPKNPVDYADGAGSHGWLAPEQLRWYRKNGNLLLNKQLSEKTNVWGVGMMCWSLMYLRTMPPQLTYDPGSRQPQLGPTPTGHVYTGGLDQFVLDCTNFDIGQRFDVAQALNSITANNGFAGMDTAVPGPHLSRDTNPDKLPFWDEHDKYRLGLTRDEVFKAARQS